MCRGFINFRFYVRKIPTLYPSARVTPDCFAEPCFRLHIPLMGLSNCVEDSKRERTPIVRTCSSLRNRMRKTRLLSLLRQAGGGVEDDVQGSDLRGLGVSVHQKSLAILGNVIRELIR